MTDWYKSKRLYWIKNVRTQEVVYVGISSHPSYRLYCHKNSKSNVRLRNYLRNNWPDIALYYSKPVSHHDALVLEHVEIAKQKKQGGCQFNFKCEPISYYEPALV